MRRKHTTGSSTFQYYSYRLCLGGFKQKLGCYHSRWISQIRWCHPERIIMIDHRKKHNTLSYISVLTVTCSQMCTTSAVCGSRGVEPGSLLHRKGPCCTAQAFKYQFKKRFLRRGSISCANSSDNAYLTPTFKSVCNLASSRASCGVSELHLSG